MRWVLWLLPALIWAQSGCEGDVNADGSVSAADMEILLVHWGETAGSPGFQSGYDVSQNGRIDVVDAVWVLNQWGNLCGPNIAGCPVFPINNIWNTRVDSLPVHAQSAAWINSIGANTGFHMDFGSGLWQGAPIGIPYTTVPGSQPLVPIVFDVEDESDPGPYPIPPDAPIEGGPGSNGDRHVLVIDADNCVLYEMFYSFPINGGLSWTAYSGAVYDLNSHALRPDTWTSADAAGLPIFPGLVRYEEVSNGAIRHALRFTAAQTQRAYVWPARHYASSNTNPNLPPMGIRVRLKASYNISGFSAENQVILTALKEYGMMLADNGSPWYISGIPDEGWDNDDLHELDVLRGSDFEVVDVSSLMVDPDSGEALPPP
ncbi:MAG: hypothetical protein KDC71_04845 [Acidobacteria bacterium]|nr:hypothetical protein [Acidobacteriota bacterium]